MMISSYTHICVSRVSNSIRYVRISAYTTYNQLRANGDVNDLKKTIERARLLLSLEEERPTSVVTAYRLNITVAALRGKIALPRSVTCYHCNQQRHVKRNCPTMKNRPLQSRKYFICGRAGHIAKNCLQENFSAASAQGRSSGHSSRQ